jgi:hypothetical protein
LRDEQLREFCEFLHTYLNPAIPVDRWLEAFRQQWGVDSPNRGFVLRDDRGQIVGGIGAIYAQRMIRGRPERFCNITSWCVLEPYRTHSMRLAAAIVSQAGYHFTDLTPTDVVASSLKFLNFRSLDRRLTFLPAIPGWTRGLRVTEVPAEVERCLAPEDRKAYLDHRHFPWLHHIVVGSPGRYCYVAYKLGHVKRLRCAAVLHVSDSELFLRFRFTLGRYFLFRRRIVAMRVESRFLHRSVWPAHQADSGQDKVFRSDTLGQPDIANLYSEAVALDL